MSSQDEKITYFAETDSRNKRINFGIKTNDRSRHMYVIGKTGMGKSTVLENMAIQDIQSGEGMAFIDPHGKSADLLLEYVPEERINDVVYFAPFDMDNPVAFNVMEDVGPDKRHLVVSGLMSAFKKIWVDAWSARMEYILSNTLRALLEYPGATLLGINKMLSDKDYRKKVVDNIKDVSVKSFWVDEFAKYTERFAAEATPAIQNKVGQFTSNPLIRNIVGQSKSTFDLRKMMDQRKIIIINLSKGRVGEDNANLLGSMLITKIYLAAMSRADVSESQLNKLPNFYLYVDEFQSFANESFANILSEARKYKLALTIAHQYIEQMSEEVRAAVFGNVGTMATFRVGAFDAEILEKEFAPQFTAEDLVNLGRFQFYIKLMIDGVSSSPFSATTLPPIERPVKSFKKEAIQFSKDTFGRARAEVEASIWESNSAKQEVKNENAQDAKTNWQAGEKKERSFVRHVDRQNQETFTPYVKQEKNHPFKKEFEKVFSEGPIIKEKTEHIHLSALKPHYPPKTYPPKPQVPFQKNVPSGGIKNIDELRKAIASAVKEKADGQKQEIPASVLDQPSKPVENIKKTEFTGEKDDLPKPAEVPEKVLKKVLGVE